MLTFNVCRVSALIRAGACMLALLSTGCATTQIGSQWSDPAFQGQSLRGARLLAACDAPEPGLQRICQDAISAQLLALGASPVQAPDPGPNGRQPPVEQMLSAARIAGATAVFSSTVSPDFTVVGDGPTISFGLGNFDGYRGGVSGGVGVTVPSNGPRFDRLCCQRDADRGGQRPHDVVGQGNHACAVQSQCPTRRAGASPCTRRAEGRAVLNGSPVADFGRRRSRTAGSWQRNTTRRR